MEKPGIDLLHFVFFYEQPVYKQLVLAWKIAKQLLGLNPLSLGNNKNYRLKKMEFFLCNKCKIAVKPKFSFLKNIFGKILKSLIINVDFESWYFCIPCIHRLLCPTTKQPLRNFNAQNTLKV